MRSSAGFAILSPAVALALLLGSCATRLPQPQPVDVLAPLDPTALVFLEAKGSDVARLAKALAAVEPVSDGQKKLRELARALEGLARRGKLFGLALLPERGIAARGGTTTLGAPTYGDKPTDKTSAPKIPAFEAAIAGDFNSFELWLNFVTARGWKQKGGEWKNASLDLAVALPQQGLLVAARHDALGLVARVAGDPPSPLPKRYEDMVDEGIVAWIPDPLNRLAPGLGLGLGALGAGELPPFGMLVLAKTEELQSESWSQATESAATTTTASAAARSPGLNLDIRVVLPDAETAKLLMPAIRVGWFFLAQNLPFEGKASFALDGDSLRIEGLRWPLARLATMLIEKAPATSNETR